MTQIELILTAVALSMDAFAVAVCKGLGMSRVNKKHAVIVALFFGGFQAAMPVIGWILGTQFERYIIHVDHWIAFVLLAFIGGKMIIESFGKESGSCPANLDAPLDYKELTLMAIATSIDALAVGLTFAVLRVSILPAVAQIGVCTFLLSLAGVFVGNFFGVKYKKRAEFFGGAVLVIIGLRILLDHLGVFV